MDEATRLSLVQILGREMSDLSEECWYAGWIENTEYCVPELCRRAVARGEPQPWGHGEVTAARARGIVALAEWLGSWATLDEAGKAYVPCQPFPVPERVHSELDAERGRRSRKTS